MKYFVFKTCENGEEVDMGYVRADLQCVERRCLRGRQLRRQSRGTLLLSL